VLLPIPGTAAAPGGPEMTIEAIEIKGIAREPGFRTKMAVYSRDSKVDPVGACVGMRGQRVKNIVRELSVILVISFFRLPAVKFVKSDLRRTKKWKAGRSGWLAVMPWTVADTWVSKSKSMIPGYR